MKNIFLTIEFDGSQYHGWQIQQNAITVQEVLQKAIYKLTGEIVHVNGASRTDEGVHALGMAANFHTSAGVPPDRFAYALNAFLPQDVVVKTSKEMPDDFHARFCAKGKTYRYVVFNATFPSALYRNRTHHVRKQLDMASIQAAAHYFIGTHDFAAFCAAGSVVKTTVRTIFDVTIQKNADLIEICVSGNGFLYNMVRIIAGTLIQVGKGEIDPNEMGDIISSLSRKRAGITAPPQGLYLVEVYYDELPSRFQV